MAAIAANIARLVRTHALDGCWLAAHKEINHHISDALPALIRQRIETNFMRDLVKANEKKLVRCLLLQKMRRQTSERNTVTAKSAHSQRSLRRFKPEPVL